MEDLKNKELFKLMWVPGTKKVLWNMKIEKQIKNEKLFYKILDSNVNLVSWIKEYKILYRLWLEEDDKSIFDINHEINIDMIKSIKKFNSQICKNSNLLIFYWFDCDRTYFETKKWSTCPINGKKLISLGDSFHYLNRMISEEYIVYPDIKNNDN